MAKEPRTAALPRKLQHLEHGIAAEQLAARYLESHGLMLIARNQRYKVGEIDIVCLDGRTVVIVEVRQRSGDDYGGALASVTHWKQRKIIRATQCFLQRVPEWSHLPLRFDVVAVNGSPGQNPAIVWIKSAFSA